MSYELEIGVLWIALPSECHSHVCAMQFMHVAIVIYCRDCLKFCFMHLIQEDLFKISLEWNSHRIRRNRNSSLPDGHPDELFYMPQLHGKWVELQYFSPYVHQNYARPANRFSIRK
jgi:hypothetical protein